MADTEESKSCLSSSGDVEAVRHMEQAIAAGKHWYIALLEAIGLWASAEETCDGRQYRYLISGEAFDWLLLAERLCEAVRGIPGDEKEGLLFHGKPPLNLGLAEVKKLIGASKYRQYLNYFYGVTVEMALLLATEAEVYKERWMLGYTRDHDVANEAFRRVYGGTRAALLKQFRQEKRYPQARSITLSVLKEFTYWLFKYRVARAEKARVASDTRKALDYLRRQRSAGVFGEALLTEESSPNYY